MKSKKGITLIALIITIIVMLILVAVTINVALNGGLFGRATDAKNKTQIAADKEKLISAMIGGYNDSGSFDANDVILPEGATWCIEEETDYASALQSGTTERNWVITENNNKFYIDSKGTVLDKKPESKSRLQYGKVYAGDINTTEGGQPITIHFKMCFYESGIAVTEGSLNGAIIGGSSTLYIVENDKNLKIPGEYDYDNEQVIYSNGTIEEDSVVLDMFETGVTLTINNNEALSYNPQLNDSQDLYNGIYKCEDNGCFLDISLSLENDSYYINKLFLGSKDNPSYLGSGAEIKESIKFEEKLEEYFGITIIDTKNISYEGKTYTLLENLK